MGNFVSHGKPLTLFCFTPIDANCPFSRGFIFLERAGNPLRHVGRKHFNSQVTGNQTDLDRPLFLVAANDGIGCRVKRHS